MNVIAASLRNHQTKTGKRICARLKSKRTGKRNRVRIMALTDDALLESDAGREDDPLDSEVDVCPHGVGYDTFCPFCDEEEDEMF